MNSHLKFLVILILAIWLPPVHAHAADTPTLRIVHASHDHHAPLFVAAMLPEVFRKDGGIYLKEIVFRKHYTLMEGSTKIADVVMDSSTGGSELVRKLAQDQYDLALGGFPAMVQAIDEGYPIRVMAPVMSGGTGLILKRELKITDWTEFIAHLRNPSAKQLRIGHQSDGSVQFLALERALKREGIKTASHIDDKEAKAILLDLHGSKNLIPSLASGVVDGFVAMQPYMAQAQKEKAGVLVAVIEDFTDETGPGLYPCCAVAAREEFLEKNRAAATKMVSLLMKASAHLVENPDEAAPLVAKWLNGKTEVEEESLPTINFVTLMDNKWMRGTHKWLNEMVESGKLTGKVKKAFMRGDETEVIFDPEFFRKMNTGAK